MRAVPSISAAYASAASSSVPQRVRSSAAVQPSRFRVPLVEYVRRTELPFSPGEFSTSSSKSNKSLTMRTDVGESVTMGEAIQFMMDRPESHRFPTGLEFCKISSPVGVLVLEKTSRESPQKRRRVE